jgi:hypothetical protein
MAPVLSLSKAGMSNPRFDIRILNQRGADIFNIFVTIIYKLAGCH